MSFGGFSYKSKYKLKDENVTFVSKSAKDFISQLNLREDENVWFVGGASIVDEFLGSVLE